MRDTGVSPALALTAASAPGLDARRPSKADQVYASVKEAILSGLLPPGSAIDKAALCDQLGMSRFPVGIAVGRLAFEKLVVVEPQHGSFVSRISLGDVREFMLIRRALEGDLAAEAAKARLPGLDMELARSLRYQATAVEAADHAGFYRLDVGFHRLIVQALGLTHAADMLERLLSHLERVRRLLTTPPGHAGRTLEDHRAIADAIAARDPGMAALAARAHLERTTAMFASFAQQNPTLFAEADHA
ncbi:GntR family transcriptional regulator [Lichenihabitans sp. Uapishka_5]|uniref:GntR family transcriptional regulator n=1 Tax=Lichenihabitans sp. Uapishka_5 TaxID=3037302 RepID=UPI0029E824CE|nr:GntR family transcriptional regulator [Lichenihabitans sp. Uapishka_5]MDX7950940.1 GntR family transcriptional regulator [Lichenihabitans sp. Uapishka_5]